MIFQRVLLFQTAVPLQKKFLNFWIITFKLLWRQENVKNIGNIPSNSTLVNAEVVGIYPSIPHNAGLQDLYKKLEERTDKKIPSIDLVKMTEFILKNNLFEFETKIIQQISGTAIGAKFVPWYGCFFLDRIEKKLLSHGCGVKIYRWHIFHMDRRWR